MNTITLMGRLTADPTINDRITCANFTLAVDRPYKKDGKTETDFIPCRLLGEKKADFANHYLRKGMKILVSGRLQVDSYEKDGKRQYSTYVVVDNTEFCESRQQQQQEQPKNSQSSGDDWINIPDGIDDSELPFT